VWEDRVVHVIGVKLTDLGWRPSELVQLIDWAHWGIDIESKKEGERSASPPSAERLYREEKYGGNYQSHHGASLG